MKLIALTGVKGSGKNTAADALSKIIENDVKKMSCNLIVEFAFADVLKNIIHEAFGIENHQADALKRLNIKPFNGLTLREVYQRLGESIKARCGENIWADMTIERIQHFIDGLKPDYIMVTDLRYTNEEVALKKFAEDNGYDLKIIKMINTNSNDIDNHISEQQIDSISEDYEITASNPQEIYEKIRELYEGGKI